MTDGLDNRSNASVDTVIDSIGSSGLTISSVGFGDANQATNSQEALDEAVLKKLASETGGLYGYAANREQLSALYASFGASMRSEYVLTYKSPYGLRNGINRSITVTLESRTGSARQPGASTTYNPGGLIPEVPVGDSWPMFFGLLVMMGLLISGPQVYPLVREKLQKPRPNIKIKEPKKVAIKLKN